MVLAGRSSVTPGCCSSRSPARGISHAFRDAELLADAVADGLGGIRPPSDALGRYRRARDRAARPMYDFTVRLAAVNPSTSAEMALFFPGARRAPGGR